MNKTHLILALFILIGLGLEVSPVFSDCLTVNVAKEGYVSIRGPDNVAPSTGYYYQWIPDVGNPAAISPLHGYTNQIFDFNAPTTPGTYKIELKVTDVLNAGCVNNACVTLNVGDRCCPLRPNNFCENDAVSLQYCYNSAPCGEQIMNGLYFKWWLNDPNTDGTPIGDNVACVTVNWAANPNTNAAKDQVGDGNNELLLQIYRANDMVLLQNCGPVTVIRIPTPDNTISKIQPP